MTTPIPPRKSGPGRRPTGKSPATPASKAAPAHPPRPARPQPVAGSRPFAALKKEWKEMWVWMEVEETSCPTVCWELLGRARMMADSSGHRVRAILLGDGLAKTTLVTRAIRSGADAVSVADHPHLRAYTTTPFTATMARLIEHHHPDILLIGATHNGRDLAGRLAVRVKTGLTADCTELEMDSKTGLLKSWVVGFGGGIAACIVCPQHRPQMATARPGVFPVPKETDRKGDVDQVPAEWVGPVNEELLQKHRKEQKDISGAKVLVVGGRGVEGRFDLIHALAAHLGGEVGATRVAVDAGWITREHQIGQTGVVARPETAIVFGASGATHFTVGIEKAKTVISVNNDPSAPMNDQADYILVGDAAKVMTEILHELHAPSGSSHNGSSTSKTSPTPKS